MLRMLSPYFSYKKKLIILSVFFALQISAYPAFAVSPEEAEQAKFTISKLLIEGNTLVPAAELQRAVQPYIGENSTIDSLQAALQAIEKVYADHGYGAIKAVLPEQEAEAGVFRISIVEAKLATVRVVGNSHYSSENIIRSAPALLSGQSPNLQKVAKTLRIANESFAKNTRAVITRSAEPGKVDAELRVTDIKPWRFAASLDNTGTETTGRGRLGFVFQHANLFDRDHAMAAQFTTSPGHEDDVKIFGLSYRIPVYRFGDTIDLAYGHSDVDSGTVVTTAGNYGISGSGDFVSANYNLSLAPWHDLEQRIVFGLNWRSFESKVVPQGSNTSLIPDLTSAPASVTYQLGQSQGDIRWLSSLGLIHNLPSGSDGDTAAYNQFGARPGAKAHFDAIRYNIAYYRPIIANWNIRAELGGQWTDDMLISGEQFGVGGANSVRGFNERELSGDKGYRGSLELGTPEWTKLKLPNAHLFGAAFCDFGYVSRNNPLPGELPHEGVSSTGLGLRMTIGQSFQVKADIARVLDGGGLQEAGDYKGHVQLVMIF